MGRAGAGQGAAVGPGRFVCAAAFVSHAWAALLSRQTLAGCAYEVVTVDDRPMPSHLGGLDAQKYWAITGVLNSNYAQRWSYPYRYVQLNTSAMPQYHPTWGKVFYVAEQLRSLERSGACKWFLFMDSDAFVREPDLPLPVLLADLGRRYRIQSDVGAIFAREQDPDPTGDGSRAFMRNYRPEAPWLNPGVFLVQASDKGRLLFNTWEALGRAVGPSFKQGWPGEMAVITELISPGVWPSAKAPTAAAAAISPYINRTVAAVDMLVMNSPWGRFVMHAWGYHDYYRETSFWDGLVRIKWDNPKVLTRQLGILTRRASMLWGPAAAAIGGLPPPARRSARERRPLAREKRSSVMPRAG